MAQGTFSAIRGGNFWQGAAAGLFSSFGGSFSGAIGITGFWGTVGVSSAMGGVGAAIGGARNTEDILFGMAAGAMVGALNFAEEASQQKNEEKTYQQKIKEMLNSVKKGGTLSGKELAKLIGNSKISWVIKKVTRINETTFEVERTWSGKSLLNDSPMTIEKTKDSYKIKIDYTKSAISLGALPCFYIVNNRIKYYDYTKKDWFYGIGN